MNAEQRVYILFLKGVRTELKRVWISASWVGRAGGTYDYLTLDAYVHRHMLLYQRY